MKNPNVKQKPFIIMGCKLYIDKKIFSGESIKELKVIHYIVRLYISTALKTHLLMTERRVKI
jgi:hypothetical protein